MPGKLNVTQEQIDNAQSMAEELFERSATMTRNDFNSKVAEDILHNQTKYRTVGDVMKEIQYCEEIGDQVRAEAMKEMIYCPTVACEPYQEVSHKGVLNLLDNLTI
jgi:hypothetical protein